MRNVLKNQFSKVLPLIERAAKWAVRTAFETLKVTALAYMVISTVIAPLAIEATLSAIVVFAAVYIPRKCR